MLPVNEISILVILIGLILGLLMIDTTPSNRARANLEKFFADHIPHPSHVNSFEKLIKYYWK